MYGKVLSVKTEMNFLLPYRKEARFLSHDEKRAQPLMIIWIQIGIQFNMSIKIFSPSHQ